MSLRVKPSISLKTKVNDNDSCSIFSITIISVFRIIISSGVKLYIFNCFTIELTGSKNTKVRKLLKRTGGKNKLIIQEERENNSQGKQLPSYLGWQGGEF